MTNPYQLTLVGFFIILKQNIMKYLLFNWDYVDQDVNDPSELTNEEFERLAQLPSGFIIEGWEDFEARFNSEDFSTETHQLRIIP